MLITVVSASVAFLAALVIPVVVSAAVRRGDRRRSARGVVPDAATGVLFTVRPRRWQHVVLRVVGILFVVVGALMALVSVVDADDMDSPGPLIAAVVILLGGGGFVLLANSMRRTAIDALPDRLRVRVGFRPERTVLLTDIASISPLMNAYGGLQAKDASGHRLFSTTGLAQGYGTLEQYLQERAPLPRDPTLGATGPLG